MTTCEVWELGPPAAAARLIVDDHPDLLSALIARAWDELDGLEAPGAGAGAGAGPGEGARAGPGEGAGPEDEEVEEFGAGEGQVGSGSTGRRDAAGRRQRGRGAGAQAEGSKAGRGVAHRGADAAPILARSLDIMMAVAQDVNAGKCERELAGRGNTQAGSGGGGGDGSRLHRCTTL